MTDHRARYGNLYCVSQAPYASHHCYQSPLPIEEMLQPEFYLPVRNNLRVGDTIRVVQTVAGENTRVLAWAEAMVVDADAKAVDLRILSGPTKIPLPKPAEGSAAPADGQPDKFVGGNGEVKWNAGRKMHEVVVGGETVFASRDKDLCTAVARGDTPIPAAA